MLIMKRTLTVLMVLALTFGFASQANASRYKLDNQKVDVMFAQAEEVQFDLLGENSDPAMASAMAFAPPRGKQKDPVVALLLDFFFGGLGVHRFYLGTKTMTGIGYILTCGGIFGIVPLVDFIMLIVNFDDISDYVDNPAFFMW